MRWLQEDPEYMDVRKQGLAHSTVQARLGKKYGVDLGNANASAEAPWLHGKPVTSGRKPPKASPEPMQQTERSYTRRGERSELTAIKHLQKEMRDSASKVEQSLDWDSSCCCSVSSTNLQRPPSSSRPIAMNSKT